VSIDSRQREVSRYTKEVAELKKKDSIEAKKEASKTAEMDRASRSFSSTKSVSTARTYQQKIVRLNSEIAKIAIKRADFSKKISDKTTLLHRSEQALSKEKEVARKKTLNLEKAREKEQLAHHKQITNELRLQKSMTDDSHKIHFKSQAKVHDVFISHASEDKATLVRPLAKALTDLGFDVWFDETSLKLGDSLRAKIDQGLASSRYGVVVLSESFFSNNWPAYELNGLVAKEMNGGNSILPIWHKVTKDEVLSFSPTLADKLALNTLNYTIPEIAEKIAKVLT